MSAASISAVLILCLSLALAGSVRAETEHTARVSDLRGTLTVRGEDEADVSSIYMNAVVRAGDTLWTDRDSRAELELEHGNWVRLSENTKVEVRSLSGSPELRLWSGSLFLDLSDREERPLRVDTPEGDVEVYPDSTARVDLGADNGARVSVYRGRARLTPERGDETQVRTTERVYVEAGRIAGSPARFALEDQDGFDQYERERADYYGDRPLPRELDRDLLGARELDGNGTWVDVDRVRYWRPNCEPDWRPYSRGYWSDVPRWGYTWVDHYPWGYTTCHYGRWVYRPAYGWLWWPGYAWGPSWVYWSTSGDYIGWAPLDPWDRPCYYGPGSFTVVNFIFDSRSWTFCHRDRFFFGRHHFDYLNHQRDFRTADQIHPHRDSVHLFRDVAREIGIPREHVRGLTIAKDGRPVREHVLALEQGLPQSRRSAIERRFGVNSALDRERLQRTSDVERLQRGPGLQIPPDRILRGDAARQRVPVPPALRVPERAPGSRYPVQPSPSRPEPYRPIPRESPRRGRESVPPTRSPLPRSEPRVQPPARPRPSAPPPRTNGGANGVRRGSRFDTRPASVQPRSMPQPRTPVQPRSMPQPTVPPRVTPRPAPGTQRTPPWSGRDPQRR